MFVEQYAMRKLILLIFYIVCFSGYVAGQGNKIGGQYIFERKGEMFSTYVFSNDSLFTFYLSGDICTTYGSGIYKIMEGRLILNFDSTRIIKSFENEGYFILDGAENLKISKITKRKMELECRYMGRVETYKKIKLK